MKNYVHSQFKSFIDKQKPGTVPKASKFSNQLASNQSEFYINSNNKISLNENDNFEFFKQNQ